MLGILFVESLQCCQWISGLFTSRMNAGLFNMAVHFINADTSKLTIKRLNMSNRDWRVVSSKLFSFFFHFHVISTKII